MILSTISQSFLVWLTKRLGRNKKKKKKKKEKRNLIYQNSKQILMEFSFIC